MTDNKFAQGISVKEIGKYGDLKISINSNKFFVDENDWNEQGWGNFIIRKSKAGKYYCIVDTFKPEKKNNDIDPDSLPF